MIKRFVNKSIPFFRKVIITTTFMLIIISLLVLIIIKQETDSSDGYRKYSNYYGEKGKFKKLYLKK